jgi:transposase
MLEAASVGGLFHFILRVICPNANDAAAICDAVTRPSMRFVPDKTKEQQTALMLRRTRQLLVRQRTMASGRTCRINRPDT